MKASKMKLGIISDCVHFYEASGKVATENHILLRQLQTLAGYFAEVLICCPFAHDNSSSVYSTYNNSNISFMPLPNVGGNNLTDKWKLVTAFPKWFRAFKKINRFSDIVYQRFPNNLNIPGFFYFYFKNKKVFATYTGTWGGYDGEPVTYRFQRWLLNKYFKGPVWAYMNTPAQNTRIMSGISPSYSRQEWNEEAEQVNQRIISLKTTPLKCLRMVTVGTLISYKNQLCILKACVLLKQKNIPFILSIVGDGPMKEDLAVFISENKLTDSVQLCGKKNHEQLRDIYRQHDFVVQAPLSEGFGKVPIEGFFHGLIPVINNIALAQQMTGRQERGFLFDATDPSDLARVLQNLLLRTEGLAQMIENGRAYAREQTLEAWAENYHQTIEQYFG